MNKVKIWLLILTIVALVCPATSNAAKTKDIILGSVVGTGLGIAGGGLFFVTTQDDDKILLASLGTGAGVGLVAGTAWGVFNPNPLLGSLERTGRPVLEMPVLTVRPEDRWDGKWTIRADVVRIGF